MRSYSSIVIAPHEEMRLIIANPYIHNCVTGACIV